MCSAPTNPSAVYAWIVRHLERLIEERDFHQVRAGRLTVWLSSRGGPTGVGEGVLDAATDRFRLLPDAARAALRRAWREGGKSTPGAARARCGSTTGTASHCCPCGTRAGCGWCAGAAA
jgi:hypothetical protein